MFGIRMGEGQGSRKDAHGGVPVAGLEGHWSRSAVYLVHRGRVSGRRRADEEKTGPQSVLLGKSDAIIRGM